jgi:mannose-6-phosphate isomerase-like protein (cupin superfamily)
LLHKKEFEGLKDVQNFLSFIFPWQEFDGVNTMKFNLVSFEPTRDQLHIDTQDMAYWHVAGKVKWGFDPNISKEIIIEPNDIILVPQGCIHGYYSIGPRAGFTFGFFKNSIV